MSLCDMTKGLKPEGVMIGHPHSGEGVIYPVILTDIDGIKTHILLNTGTGSSYAFIKLIKSAKQNAQGNADKKK